MKMRVLPEWRRCGAASSTRGRGGAHGDHASCRFVSRLEAVRDRVGLLVHLVVGQKLGLHRTEGAEPDMKRDEGMGEAGEQFGREVKSRGGRGDRSGLARA